MLHFKHIITLVLAIFALSACGLELVKPLDESILEVHNVKSAQIQESQESKACKDLNSMSQKMNADSSPEEMNKIAETYSECADTVEEPTDELDDEYGMDPADDEYGMDPADDEYDEYVDYNDDDEYVDTELDAEDLVDMYCMDGDTDCDPDYFKEEAPESFSSDDDDRDDTDDWPEFAESDNCGLMIGFGDECGDGANKPLYWPKGAKVRVEIDGYKFDFWKKSYKDSPDLFIDGPGYHNGGYTITKNIPGHLEMDIHIGNNKPQTSDMNVHLSIKDGLATVTEKVKDGFKQTVKVTGNYTITFTDDDGEKHTVSW